MWDWEVERDVGVESRRDEDHTPPFETRGRVRTGVLTAASYSVFAPTSRAHFHLFSTCKRKEGIGCQPFLKFKRIGEHRMLLYKTIVFDQKAVVFAREGKSRACGIYSLVRYLPSFHFSSDSEIS